MYYTKQDDYDKFICSAGNCPKTCCAQWLIEIDSESLTKYREEKSSFSAQLAEGIDWNNGTFKLNDSRCSMLNPQNLCNLQLALGEDALCYTCRMYPRHIEEYDGIRELSLSLSCPEVARMVISRSDKYTFLEMEDDLPEPCDDFDDFDFLLHSSLEYSRKAIYDILTCHDYNIWIRFANVLSLCKKLQTCIECDNIFEIEKIVDEYVLDENIDTAHWLNVPMAILKDIEFLDPSWLNYIKKIEIFYNSSNYANLTTSVTIKESTALENIAVLLIYSFFCGAVYNDQLYSKAALCIISSWWIYVFYRCASPSENMSELEIALYTYASEIEHSDTNLIALEKYLKSFHFD